MQSASASGIQSRSANEMTPKHEAIARYLASLYDDLVNRHSYSVTVNHNTEDAPAWGCARRLLIVECDSDDLSLVSTYRASWVVDDSGFREEEDLWWDCPPSTIYKGFREPPADHPIKNPFVKYSSDRSHVRVGLRFGPDWYVVKEACLDEDGLPLPHSFVEVWSSANLR